MGPLLITEFAHHRGDRLSNDYFSVGSVFFVLGRGIYHITLDFTQLCEKLVGALIVPGESGAETIADNKGTTMAKQWNIFP